jgi:hypothetical protein
MKTAAFQLSQFMLLLMCASTAIADNSGGDNRLAPVPLRPFRPQLPSGHLFGDRGGARTKLEDAGITPALTLVTGFAWNPTGGKQQGSTAASNLGLDLLFDMDKLGGVKGASILVQLSQRFGTSLSKDYIGNVFNTQQVFGGETFRVVDVAWQQKLFDDRVQFRVGRFAAGDDFLVSPYNYLFMQNGFCGNPVVNILSTFLAMGLIDRWDRKPLLLAGSIGMVITLAVMAIVFGTAPTSADGKPVIDHTAAITGLIAANLYIVAFGVSWGPVVWVLLGEMFPNQTRGAALAVSGATNWAANFAVTVTFLPLLRGAGLGCAYGLYAAASFVSLLFVWFAVDETKGRTLEEM